MKLWPKHRRRQRIGLYVGAYLAFSLSVYGGSGLFPGLMKRGPMTIGHETLACTDCHQSAPGTLRQQLQAKVQYGIGRRKHNPAFGHLAVDNAPCLNCHDRPNDTHPVFRFIEPRFADVRKKLGPQYCRTCHLEHKGRRVTQSHDTCRQCHEKLAIKKDPLVDTNHKQLIADKQWTSCLGCHDYHGNHRYKTSHKMEDMIPLTQLEAYFVNAETPYSKEKFYAARKEKR